MIPDTKECFSNYMGLWLIEPEWGMRFRNSLAEFSIEAVDPGQLTDGTDFKRTEDGIAVVSLIGNMMKGLSKFGGASTIQARREIRSAVGNKDIRAILLLIDSPGGTVAGTQELANEVRAANQVKPVYTQIEDLGASASDWVGSQARKVFANETALVGSIGTVAVVHDSSEAFERAGVKVHVISTGDFKGAFSEGTPITEEMLADAQEQVNDLNEIFLRSVSEGRSMPIKDVKSIADGRVHVAKKAKGLGLIDAIKSTDETFAFIRGQFAKGRRRARAETLNDRLMAINGHAESES